MQKKKIAIFGVKYFPSKGGTSRVVENLLWELKDHFEFTVYCYRHEAAKNYMEGVKTIQFSETPIKGFGVFWYYFKCFVHILLKGNYDIVHLHKTDGAFFLPFLNLKYKTIATSHALPYHNDKWSGLGKLYFKMVERLFMNSGSILTAVSQTQVEYYQQKYKNSVIYIPNSIHPPKEIKAKDAIEIITQHHIPESFILFAARRVIPLKGCHTLIDALQQINYKGTLVIAGDDKQLPSYTKKLKEMARGLNVIFIGYIAPMERLNALIAKAQFFLFPSEIEGMSMMLLEVGSLATPMICSDIPQNTAVLSADEVLYFESKNANDLAKKLDWAIAHPNNMKALAKKAKQKIEEEYMVSVVVQQYIDLYNRVVEIKELTI